MDLIFSHSDLQLVTDRHFGTFLWFAVNRFYEHMVFTSYLNLTCLLYVFLANYVPKCQMSSGPFGPIFYP